MKSLLNIEEHPLEPFLPVNAKLLMLGFSPTKETMEHGILLSQSAK